MAGNLFSLSNTILCWASFCAYMLYEIGPWRLTFHSHFQLLNISLVWRGQVTMSVWFSVATWLCRFSSHIFTETNILPCLLSIWVLDVCCFESPWLHNQNNWNKSCHLCESMFAWFYRESTPMWVFFTLRIRDMASRVNQI